MDDQKAKTQLFKALTLFIMVGAALAVYSILWGPMAKQSASFYPSRTISVSAQGKTTVTPDIARVSFSVVSEGLDASKIMDENNRKMNQAIDFVKSLGIDVKDIKTTQYNLSPKYNYDRFTGQSMMYGYTMTQGVLVSIRDFTKVPSVLSGLPGFGINQVSGVSFEVESPEKYLSEARTKAFAEAKAKARTMAKANNVRIKRVMNFSEYGGGYPIPYYAKTEMAMGMGGDAMAPVAPTIEPGTEEATVQVSVTYELW